MVKFDRAQVQAILTSGETVLTLIGKVGLVDLGGQDTIKVIDNGKGKKKVKTVFLQETWAIPPADSV